MIIELKQVKKTYQPDSPEARQEVLKDIDFTVNRGDSISIVGPSGSGKSTLLNVMGTLDQPTTGKVIFNEKDTARLKPKQLAILRNQHIGFVFQQHHLLPQLTMMENIMVPLMIEPDKQRKQQAFERANELLNEVKLSDKTHKFPGQLSVGECQRTAVVRALINEPELLLADEPTGSLDEDSAAHLVELLNKINQEHQVAVVMVTHALHLAKKMNSVYNLVSGKLTREQ